MVYLGCHLSCGKGFRAMVRTAESIGADTFAYFTRNPRGSKGKDPDKGDIAAALAELKEQGFGKLVAPWGLHHESLHRRPGSPLFYRFHSGGRPEADGGPAGATI